MARPLINLFFPELSGMIQPLSGEYAGRRALLESVPFFTGYAVEIGLLIDIIERYGLPRHRPGRPRAADPPQPAARQPVADGFVILQAAIRKLEERHRIELLTEVGRGMKVIAQEKDRFSLEVREIGDELRPPIRTIPAYLERRKHLSASACPTAALPASRPTRSAARSTRWRSRTPSRPGGCGLGRRTGSCEADGRRRRGDARRGPRGAWRRGRARTVTTTDPLGRPMEASWLLLDGGRGAFVEMASASGSRGSRRRSGRRRASGARRPAAPAT